MFEVLMMSAGAPMAPPAVWTQLALSGTKPRSRDSHTLTSVGDKLYLHGGSPSGVNLLGDLWEYDIVSNAWIELKPSGTKPSIRRQHTLTSVRDKLYLYGGNSSGTNMLGDLWEYDIVNNVWIQLNPSGSKPSGRFTHTLTSVGSKLYLHGGYRGRDDLWEYVTP